MARFDPAEHLRLADELAESDSKEESPSEIRLRTAVNRAYYGLFLAARDIADVIESENVHASVIYQIRRRFGHLVAQRLENLRELRAQADYEFPPDPAFADWNENWLNARRMSEQLLVNLRIRIERG